MSTESAYDVIVVGVGGFGSAILSSLARRGLSVLGLERHHLIHTRGSSHGYTRIFRHILYEKPFYNPWAAAAYHGWLDLAERAGEPTYVRCGSVDLAPDGHEILSRVEAAALALGAEHERLDAAELTARFPGMVIPEGVSGVFQPQSGLVLPERAIHLHVTEALAAGAEIRAMEPVHEWDSNGDGVTVKTEQGTYRAARVIFTTGAYTAGLFDNGLPIRADRAILGWFQPTRDAARFESERFPCWTLEDEKRGHFYGLPVHGYPGFKLGPLFTRGSVDPVAGGAEPDNEDEAVMRDVLATYFPEANGSRLALMSCYFENTPDRDPIIDRVPGHPDVFVAAGFSGHGFKYVPAVAEVMSALLAGETPREDLPIEPFSISRFDGLTLSPTKSNTELTKPKEI
jgi:sarcosine oxidase